MLILEILNEFYNILKVKKMTILLVPLKHLLSWCASQFSKERSDQANILDLVLTIDDLYFQIIKSKIKNFSPAMIPGILADPLLREQLKERATCETFIEPFFHSMIIYQRCSSVSVYIFNKTIEQQRYHSCITSLTLREDQPTITLDGATDVVNPG